MDMAALQRILFDRLEARAKGWKNRKLDVFLMVLIVLNVIAVVLESDSRLSSAYHGFFLAFEIFSVLIFTLEFLARLWVAPLHESDEGTQLYASRWRYLRSPLALVDLLAILPFYLGLFIDFDLRVLRTIRLLRIFKLTRYSSAMDLLLAVIRKELPTFMSATFLMLVAMLLSATGIFLVEQRAQPQVFGSIPQSLWWAVVTLTTVGYGDVVPVTLAGKVLGGLITLIGVTMVALPAGILAAGFTAELARRRSIYLSQVRNALEDGDLTWGERRLLETMRGKLGLNREEAKMLIAEGRYEARESTVVKCPHCKEAIHIAHPAGKILAKKHDVIADG